MTANKLIFGITGGSGVGKSYVAKAFERLGVTVFDGDEIAHEIALPTGEAYFELKDAFGGKYFDEDGFLKRQKLAELVFSDKSKLDILNSVMHKHIKNKILKGIENAEIAAIDGAVIIGSPVEELCRFLVGVTAPLEARKIRISERDGISEEAVMARILAQPDEDFYRKNCDFIIENDGDCDILPRARKILEEMKGQ